MVMVRRALVPVFHADGPDADVVHHLDTQLFEGAFSVDSSGAHAATVAAADGRPKRNETKRSRTTDK